MLNPWLSSLTPLLFAALWSTGFIGAKLGAPYAEPFTFLALRFTLAALLLGLIAGLWRAPWPRRAGDVGHLAVAGLLIHGVYLGGVFYAIDAGLPAGVAALIVGLQPLLTAAVAGRLLGERFGGRVWFGLALGLGGVALVLSDRFGGSIRPLDVAVCALALCSLSAGTLYQKRFCAHADLRSGGALQYAVSAALLFVVAWFGETMRIQWSGEFLFALAWLVLVLSVGAVGLLFTLIRQGEAYRVASYFYLSPPFAAGFAYLLFGETLSTTALFGMAVAAGGVLLVNLGGARRAP